MTATIPTGADLLAISELVDDRPQDNVFQIDRRVFTDSMVFDAELRYVFESTWNFIGLESQVAAPHDFVTTDIGRHPILITRSGAGVVRAFLNTCRHRGTIVCPFTQGRQKFHVCRYHGWAYDSGGRNISVTDEATGQYPATFAEANHDLIPVARLGNYRGFLFASLSPDVPPIEEFLGDARLFLDLMVDQSESGAVEFVPGSTSYTFDANWKLQFENGLDYYHLLTTHSSYLDIAMKRAANAGLVAGETFQGPDEQEGQGSFSFDYGHAVNWTITGTQP